MYIELLKRLDDSNDRIRIEAARAFALFLPSAARAFALFLPSVPRGYDPGQFDYIVRGLLVHLDDQNPEVQQGVLPAALAAAAVNPGQMITIVRSRSLHW
ncbi:hypothetical protein T484DRAFT_1846831 [Baffinella frigidus]|nr:hypothetical protein T484DRAFT_1846831 [Cryptophyta sp. CCMP2293]